MRASSTVFLPHLEHLESRLCLACTIDVHDDKLTIVGDNAANTIAITHDGAGNVSVICDAEPAVTASGIKEIEVDTGDGDDSLTLAVTGELTKKLELELDLGAGNDIADLDFAAIAGKLEIEADLGAGNDVLDINLDQEIRSKGKVELEIDGGDGDDSWILSVNEARSKAKLHVNFDGGNGNDVFEARLGDPIDAKGHVQIHASGGAGNDSLTVDATTFGTGSNIASKAKLQVHLDGGAGTDTLVASHDGEVDGMLQIHLNAGADNDIAALNATANAGSKGKVQLKVNGDAGDDNLTLNFTDLSNGSKKSHSAMIDGGLGIDTCVATSNVKKRNCEL